jgi:glutathione S-transferase
MLRYIERRGAAPALIPAGLHQAARMDQLLCIVDNYLFRTAAFPIGFNRLIAPRIGAPVNEEAVRDAIEPCRTVLGAINALYADAAFLAGETLTLADIAIVPHLDFLARTPEGAGVLEEFSRLRAWLERMRERPSVKRSARPPEEVLRAA